MYRDQRKGKMGRALIRAERLAEGWVCQSDRSWLGRAISWLSSRLAFRKESRMYSSGSMVALGIVAFEVACTGMLYSLPLAVREILCGLRTNTQSRGCDSVSLPPDCIYVIRVRYANDSAFERAALKVHFKGAISQHRCGIDTISWFSDLFQASYVGNKLYICATGWIIQMYVLTSAHFSW